MLIKFKPSTTSEGVYGFVESIKRAATAAAGTTPSKPSYVDDWEVMSNTTAGGWTTVSHTNTSSGTLLELAAPTAKADVDTDTYKMFSVYRSTASANYGHTYCRAQRWVGNLSTVTGSITDTTNLTYTASQQTAPYGRYWMGYQTTLASMVFYVAVTAEYLWVWKEYNSTSADDRHLIGISDLTAGTVWDYSAGSRHFPVGGVYTGTSDTTTDNQYTNYRTRAYGIKNQNESYGKYFNELTNWVADISVNTSTSVAQNYAIPITSAYTNTQSLPAAVSTSNYYKSSWDLTGFDRTTVNDIVLTSPLNGWNSRKLKGVAQAGWNRYYNQYDTQQLHSKVVSVGSQNWLLLEMGKVLWALKVT